MSLADDLLQNNPHTIEQYLADGNHIDDIDEYGFTPLIETAISDNLDLAKIVLEKKADINRPDMAGRTALHWTIDNGNKDFSKFLLDNGANPNAYSKAGQTPLVYPLLRNQKALKHLLYEYKASLQFAQDFMNTKLLGHRYHLSGSVDILNADGEFIELDYEGFFLEFSIDIILNSLNRFKNNFAARHLRDYFTKFKKIIHALSSATKLLKFQRLSIERQKIERVKADQYINKLLSEPLVVLPVAYRGHAICFIRMGNLLAKIDRGENSLREGTVNLYYVTNHDLLDPSFLAELIYKRQTERYLHHHINDILGLQPILQLPLTPQISGNCSWANIEASVPTAFLMLSLAEDQNLNDRKLESHLQAAMNLYSNWQIWDQDRALDECIKQFHQSDPARKATKAAILAGILFQSCKYPRPKDLERAEKILPILTMKEYDYILKSYVKIYCIGKHTQRGNSLLHFLDDFGVNLGSMHVHARPMKRDEEDKK